MHSQTRRRIWIAAAVAAFAAAGTQPGRAQQAELKPAEQVYKNITHMKGTPAEQLIPAMQVMSSALGVNCEFCHIEGKRDLGRQAGQEAGSRHDRHDRRCQ